MCVCDGRMQGTSAGIALTGHSIILYMSSGARALLIALCLPSAYKWRETWVYIQQWATAWSLKCVACRGTVDVYLYVVLMKAYRIYVLRI